MKVFLQLKTVLISTLVLSLSFLFAAKVAAQSSCPTMSLNFTGDPTNDQRVEIPNNTLTNLNSKQFSVSLWFYTRATGDFVPLLTDGNYGNASSFDLYVNNGALTVQLRFKNEFEAVPRGVFHDTIIVLNKWTHVTIVRDNTNLKLYVNGKFSKQVQVPDSINQMGALQPVNVGRFESIKFTPERRHLNGMIDELQFFDVALNDATISSNYNNYFTSEHPKYSYLKAYWDFNENQYPLISKSGSTPPINITATLLGNPIPNYVTGSPYPLPLAAISSITATNNITLICFNAKTDLTANVSGKNVVTKWYNLPNGKGTELGTGPVLSQQGKGTYYARDTGVCGSVAEKSIVITDFTTSPGTIAGSHTVPFPRELHPDFIKNAAPAVLPTAAGPPSYVWQKSIDNTSWTPVVPASPTPGLTFDTVKQTTFFRRNINTCSVQSSNVVTITVFKNGTLNGTITGSVKSVNGIGVPGINIKAKKKIPLLGSPQPYEYNTVTDQNGSFILKNVFYGDADNGDPSNVEFDVTAEKAKHFFVINNFTVALSASNPTLNNPIEFKDTTVYGLSGWVYQICDACLLPNQDVTTGSIKSGMDSVVMKKFNGSVGGDFALTESGSFSTAVSDPGIYKIKPAYKNHTFSPVDSNISVVGDVSNIFFNDLAVHTISGVFLDGCKKYMGKVTLIFEDILDSARVRKPSQFRKKITTDASGNYTITLPARRYKVRVITPALVTQTDGTTPDQVMFFFNSSLPEDSISRDISVHDTILNLYYQRPPFIAIAGLDTTATGCKLPVSNRPYAFLGQIEKKAIKIIVSQGMGTGSCPMPYDPAKNVLDTIEVRTSMTKSNGDETHKLILKKDVVANITYALDTLVGGTPNIIADFTKNLFVDFTDDYKRNTNSTRKVVVTGVRARDGAFTTVSPELPFLILHDPPGDQSFSSMSSGTSVEKAVTWSVGTTKGLDTWEKVKVGFEYSAGAGISTTNKVWGEVAGQYNTSGRNTTSGETIITTTTTNTISTASDANGIGDGGDVYVGGAMNLKYAMTDEIYALMTPPACKILTKQNIIIAPIGFATTYHYSENHIKNDVLPTLRAFANAASVSAAKKLEYASQVGVWETVLSNNAKNKKNAVFEKNISFDGSIGPITNTITSRSTKSNTIAFNMEIDKDIATELGFEVAGNGLNGGVVIKTKIESDSSVTTDSTTETSVSYTLKDKDAGDFFSVNIKKDKVYNTPAFETVAGKSSCPPEPNTLARDEMALTIDVPTIHSSTDDAVFKFVLANLSNDVNPRTYSFSLDQATNDGATVSVNGSPLTSAAILYTLPYRGKVTLFVKIHKDAAIPIFAYEGLEFTFQDNCTNDVKQIQTINAFFELPCSNLYMVTPEADFRVTNDTLRVKFNQYTAANLQSVSVEYLKKGSSQWVTAITKSQSDLLNTIETNLIWNPAALPDGEYSVRLKLVCAQGTTYTQRVSGIIDRKAPILFGKPEPTDNIFSNGDVISFSYNEDIANVDTLQVELSKLRDGTKLSTTVSSYKNTLIISPKSSLLLLPAGDSIRVIVKGITDLYGNKKILNDTIRFDILKTLAGTGRRLLTVSTYSTPSILTEKGPGTMNFTFKILDSSYDRKVNFAIAGTAIFEDNYTVSFADSTRPNSYNGATGTIFIRKGDTTATIRVKPVNDTLYLGNKSVIMYLLEGGDYVLGTALSGSGTIIDDETSRLVLYPPGSSTFCQSDSLILTANNPDGTSTVQPRYTWYKDTVIIPNAIGKTYAVTQPGKYTVTSEQYPTKNTAATAAYAINLSITSIVADQNNLCSGGTILWVAGKKGEGTLAWSKVDSLGLPLGAALGSSDSAFADGVGRYKLFLDSRCKGDTSIFITIKPATASKIDSVTAAIKTPLCLTATTILTAYGIRGSDSVITWHSTDHPSDTLSKVKTLLAGPGTYFVRVRSKCGSVKETFITVASKRTVSIQSVTAAANPVCSNALTTLTANGVKGTDSTITWFSGPRGTGTKLGTELTLTKGPGTYYALVTSLCKDTVEASITVTAFPTTAAINPATADVCTGDSVTITASGGVAYVWNTSENTPVIKKYPASSLSGALNTYSVTVTEAAGCKVLLYSKVKGYSKPVSTISPSTVSVCPGDAVTLNAPVSAIYKYSYMWNTGDTTASITTNPLASSQYSVKLTVLDNCGTPSYRDVTVKIPPAIAINSVTSSICAGQNLTLTASGGISYLWSNGDTLSSTSVGPIVTTTYTVVGTGVNGCTNTASRTVNIKNTFSEESITKCVSYTWNGNVYTSSGDYIYYTTNNVGCDSSATLHLTIISSTTSEQTVTSCHSYTWRGTTYNTSGDYTYTSVNAGGCDSITILHLTISTFTAKVTPAYSNPCNGQSSTLTASGGVSYLWNTGQTTAGITVNPSVTTTYTVTITNANGCTLSASGTVIVNNMAVSVSAQALCVGNQITAAITGNAASIEWQLNGSPVAVFPYYIENGITAAGGNGTGDSAKQLSNPAALWLDVNGNIYVADSYNHRVQKWTQGATSGITVAGGNGLGSDSNQLNYPTGVFVDTVGNVYVADQRNNRIQKWLPGATSGITVAGGNGRGGAMNQLNIPLGVFVDAANNIYVADNENNRVQKWAAGAVTGTTVAGGKGYGDAANQLSGPSSVYVDGSGNIFVADKDNDRIQKWTPNGFAGTTVAGGNGYGSADNQLAAPSGVFVDAAGNVFVADADNNRVQKASQNSSLVTTVAGGNGYGSAANQLDMPASVFVGSNGNLFIADQFNDRIQKIGFIPFTNGYTPAATGSYIAIITAAGGCEATSNTVTVNAVPVAKVTPASTAICSGSSVVLTASGGTTYKWSNLKTTTAITVNPIATTTYTVTATKLGCTNTASSVVTVSTPKAVIAPATVSVCQGQPATLTASGGVTYSWNTGQTSAVLSVTPAVTTPYTVTVKDSYGCTAKATRYVDVSPQPNGALTPVNPAICFGKSVTLTATGGTYYTWNNGATTTSITVSPAATTTYSVVVSNGSYCTTTLTTTVTVNSLPVVSISPATAVICEGQSQPLTASGGGTYLWTGGETTASVTKSPGATLPYTVTVTNANGCVATATRTVTVKNNPVAIVTPASNTICPGASTTFTASGGIGYQWSPTGETVASITKIPAASSSYTVTVTGSNGCTATAVGSVTVTASTVITANPSGNTYCKNDIAVPMFVSGTGTGNLTYQWYVNSVNSTTGGTVISGSTSPSFTPETPVTGILYYYAVVTGTCGTATSSTAAVSVKALTMVSLNPSGNTYCINATANAMSVSATGTGPFTYKWYSNTANSNTGGTAISGALAASYTPATNVAETTYYYAVVNGTCGTATSATAEVIVTPATAITADPAGNTYCQNATAVAMSISATGTGTLTYQWYSNTTNTNTGGVLISGATSASYTPATTTQRTTYYYVVVSGTCGVVTSQTAGIVVNAATIITNNPVAGTYCPGTAAGAMSVSATGFGALSYQWYSNAVNSNAGGTAIGGATAVSYIPVTTTPGIVYYYAEVSGICGTATTAQAAITVNAATNITSAPIGNIYCQNAVASAMSVSATGTGTLVYQWYSNTINANTGGAALSGATSNTYTPSTIAPGTTYYYATVTATCGTVTSATATVVVNATNTAGAALSTPTVCMSSDITNITHATTGATGISNSGISGANGLPAGVAASFASNTIIISGTPSASGTFNYSIPLTGGCGSVNATGTIIVKLNSPSFFSSTKAAYSLRSLACSYSHTAITQPANVQGFTNSTAPVVRVRRSSDNALLDIGYTANGDFDTTVLKNFASAGNAFVQTWYDQSGNSFDVTQSTMSQQPRIVNAGIVERSNGKPSVRFIGVASTVLQNNTPAGTMFTSGYIGSAYAVLEASAGYTSAFGYGAGGNSNRWQVHLNESDVTHFEPGSGNNRTSFSNAANTGLLKCYSFIAKTSTAEMYVTGVLQTPAVTIAALPCTQTQFNIGGIPGFSYYHDNHQSELIIYNSTLSSADKDALENNQQLYYRSLTSKTTITNCGSYTWNNVLYTSSGTYTYNIKTADGWDSTAILDLTINTAVAITTNPAGSTYCQNAAASPISVSAPGVGRSYQWFSNTTSDSTGGAIISGATSAFYTPPTSTAGIVYYYAIVTAACGTGTSSVCAIVINAATTVSGNPTGNTYCINAGAAALSVTASGTGTISYQWYTNTTNSAAGGTVITGATASSYTPLTTTAGTSYYYVSVTGSCGAVTSLTAAVVVNAATAIISNPVSSTYCFSTTAAAMSVSAAGTGLTYQWYKNSTNANSGGTLLTGETGSSYTPLTTTAGTSYYHISVAGTCGAVTSSTATVVVNAATAIVSSPAGSTYCINTTASAMSVTATGTGTLSYQWYSNTANVNSGGTLLSGATASSYTPITTTAGTSYYYVSVAGTCGIATSSTATVLVNATTSITANPAGNTYCQNATAIAMSVSATGSGTLAYQWYNNATNSNTGGTAISGAVSASYTPATTIAGTSYYYVSVTGGCVTAKSNPAAIIVNEVPIITSNPSSFVVNPPGTDWVIGTSAADNDWYAVTYGNGLFVAVAPFTGVAGSDKVMTSPDGFTWTSRTPATSNSWYSVTYGNGLFVAVSSSGTGNRVMTSPNGITWTSRTSAANNQWMSVTYGNGLFVAVANNGTGNRVMTSPDGINWTIRTSAADNTWRSVTYGNGLFVAVAQGSTGDQIMTSPDGITWTSRTSAANDPMNSVTYGNGLFVAVSAGINGNRVISSPDGITWTSRTSAAVNQWNSVTYANGLFVAVAGNGTGNRVMTSPDGINWTIRTSAADNTWRSVTYGNGLFVAVGGTGTGNRVMTSSSLGAAYTQNATAVAISVSATGSGTLFYQWYSNATNSNTGGTVISGATSASYTPSTAVTGTVYYYAIVTSTCSITSNVAAITVNAVPIALHFDGNNDNVSVPDNAALNLSQGNFTLEFWAKPTIVDNTARWVVSKDNGNSSLDYLIGLNGANQWTFYAQNLTGVAVGTTNAVANTWYHIAAVFENGYRKLYVNGNLEATGTFNNTPVSSTSSLRIGSRYIGAPTQFFGGAIDELRIWSKALCSEEINGRMAYEMSVPQSNLVAYYRFNQGTVDGTNTGITTLVDSSGNARTGTLNSFTKTGSTSNFTTGKALGILSTSPTCLITRSNLVPAIKDELAKEQVNELSFVLSPNPSNSQFKLQVRGRSDENVQIRIFDVNGRKIMETKGVTGQSFVFGNEFTTGIYLIEIRQGKELKLGKAVKISR